MHVDITDIAIYTDISEITIIKEVNQMKTIYIDEKEKCCCNCQFYNQSLRLIEFPPMRDTRPMNAGTCTKDRYLKPVKPGNDGCRNFKANATIVKLKGAYA